MPCSEDWGLLFSEIWHWWQLNSTDPSKYKAPPEFSAEFSCMEVSETNIDNGGQNESSEPDDSTDSKSNDTKSWIYVSFVLALISLASIIIIRRKVSSKNKNIEELKDKTIVEINPPIMPALQLELGTDEQLTVLHQWTDNNGYTWKQMSDRSMLWWNGQEWVPVNYN